jgi:4-amino-4-deoxy-L-arabinose transferase-like glycosyltransferase
MRWREAVAPWLLGLAAALVLWRSPWEASQLLTVPDAVEYAVSAQRLATLGELDIVVDGRALPPRYAPGFPVLLLAPAYALLGPDLGNAIVPVLLCGVAAVLAAYRLGRGLGGPAGGALAALAVTALPDFQKYGARVMSDVPACAFALWACVHYVEAAGAPERRLRVYAAGGTLAALAAAMRPLTGLAVLPWLLLALRVPGWPRRARALALCGAPLALWLAAGLAYNAHAFGSPLRTGYHLWLSVPADYPSLEYSLAYVPRNFGAVLWEGGALLALAAGLVLGAVEARRAPPPVAARARRVLLVLGLLGAPLVAHHLVFYFASSRYLLPVAALGATLAAGALGRRLAFVPQPVVTGALVAALAGAAAHAVTRPVEVPTRRLAAERLRATPDDALVVTQLLEPYLEPLALRGSARRVMPLTRKSEYASKLLAWRRVPDPRPYPRHPRDHRCKGLVRAGAEDAVRRTASEDLDGLERELRAGRAVFVQTTTADQARERRALDAIRARFALEPAGEELFRLRLRNSA